MKAIVLCGGRGIIDPDSRQRIPKALMQVGGRPLIWHVMKIFATAGFSEFILALGESGDAIRHRLLYQHIEGRDIEIVGGTAKLKYLTRGVEDNWRIKCVDTGINAQTGCRIARCRRYVKNETFFLTYSDCLCDVDIPALLQFHKQQGKLVTITGVQPTSRSGAFSMKDSKVIGYSEQTRMAGLDGYINGGFMIMEPGIFNYLDVFNECTLEREVFSKLADQGEVSIFPHHGYWQAVDTERDLNIVTKLYLDNQRPWLSESVNEIQFPTS